MKNIRMECESAKHLVSALVSIAFVSGFYKDCPDRHCQLTSAKSVGTVTV